MVFLKGSKYDYIDILNSNCSNIINPINNFILT